MKRLLFACYQRVVRLFWGTGLSRVPFIYWVYSSVFRLLSPKTGVMEIGGHKMCSGMKGLPSSFTRTFQAYIMKKGWEEETTRLFQRFAKKGDVIVDVGANIGYYTLLAAGIVGEEGKVYAFEPDTNNYKILTSNVGMNGFGNVIAEQKAVSDKNGEVALYLNPEDMGAHTLYQSDKAKHSVVVDSVTLDEYFKGKEYPISIVKMDIEGAEPYALSGMKNILRLNKGLKIFAEFHPPWVIRAGVSPEGFIQSLLEDYKFSIIVIQDYTRHVKSSKITSVPELMAICKTMSVVNLLLERE